MGRSASSMISPFSRVPAGLLRFSTYNYRVDMTASLLIDSADLHFIRET